MAFKTEPKKQFSCNVWCCNVVNATLYWIWCREVRWFHCIDTIYSRNEGLYSWWAIISVHIHVQAAKCSRFEFSVITRCFGWRKIEKAGMCLIGDLLINKYHDTQFLGSFSTEELRKIWGPYMKNFAAYNNSSVFLYINGPYKWKTVNWHESKW